MFVKSQVQESCSSSHCLEDTGSLPVVCVYVAMPASISRMSLHRQLSDLYGGILTHGVTCFTAHTALSNTHTHIHTQTYNNSLHPFSSDESNTPLQYPSYPSTQGCITISHKSLSPSLFLISLSFSLSHLSLFHTFSVLS